MTFELATADSLALDDVIIHVVGNSGEQIDPNNPSEAGVRLDRNSLMFPPKVTKDSKTANWKEWVSGGYEPGKFYMYSQPRVIGLEFQWIIGSHKNMNPTRLRRVLSGVRSYFYSPFFGRRYSYPVANIYALYDIVPKGKWSGKANNWNEAIRTGEHSKPSAWRVMNSDMKYSEELAQIDGVWHPLHTVLSMTLEGVSQIVNEEGGEKGPMGGYGNLPRKPRFEWY